MCNIAGYVGSRPAAPILIDMLRREEGFWAGYYTGISTLHEGKIYYAKLTGDLDRLLANTDAASLPGNIGIIHGRSKSGGDDEWAHPFIGEKNGEARIAYVANGSNGAFANLKHIQDENAEKLAAKGYIMRSRSKNGKPVYPVFSDGTFAHVSDVMCQLILSNMDGGMSAEAAIGKSFCEMPAEIVGLMLSLTHPDSIVYSRINEPMFVGFADHGAYLATAHFAFPDDASEPTLLPTCTSGAVYRDRFTAIPYKAPPKVVPMTAGMRAEVYGIVINELGSGEKSFADLWSAAFPRYKALGCIQIEALLYDIVSDLLRTGKAEYGVIRVEGSAPGLDAPQFMLKLK